MICIHLAWSNGVESSTTLNLETWSTLFNDCWLIYMKTHSTQGRTDLTGISAPVSIVHRNGLYLDLLNARRSLLFFYKLEFKELRVRDPTRFLYFQKISRCRAILLDYYADDRTGLPVYKPFEVKSVSKTYLCVLADPSGNIFRLFDRQIHNEVTTPSWNNYRLTPAVEYRWVLYVWPTRTEVISHSPSGILAGTHYLVQVNIYVPKCSYCIRGTTKIPPKETIEVPIDSAESQIRAYRARVDEVLDTHERYSFITIHASRVMKDQQKVRSYGKDVFTKNTGFGHMSFTFNLIEDWIKARNGTALINIFESNHGWKLFTTATFNFGFASLRYDTSTLGDTNVVVTGSDGIRFLTCDGQKRFVNLKIFLEPFQATTWWAITVVSFVVGSFLILGSKVQNLSDLLSAVAFPLIVLVEVFETTLIRIAHERPVNIILTTWAVTSIIFTNSYKGILTADMYRDMPVEGYLNFSQLFHQNFTFLHEIPTASLHENWFNWSLAQQKEEIQKVYTKRSSRLLMKLMFAPFGKLLFDMLIFSTILSNPKPPRGLYIANKLMKNMQIPKTFPERTVEEEICECNRTAFVAYSSELQNFDLPQSLRSTFSANFFSVGQEILRSPVGWASSEPVKGMTMRMVTQLVENGLYAWTQERFRSLAESPFSLRKMNANTENFKQILWTSNFNLSTWLLVSITVQVCLVVFMVEVIVGYVEFSISYEIRK